MHGATKRLRRQADRYGLDLRGMDHRQQRRLTRRLGRLETPSIAYLLNYGMRCKRAALRRA